MNIMNENKINKEFDKKMIELGFKKTNHLYANGYLLLGTVDDDIVHNRLTLYNKITRKAYKVYTFKDIKSILEQIKKDSV